MKNRVHLISYKEYQDIHKYINNTYGRACKCERCGRTDAKKYDWALREGCEYAKDISVFIQLCRSCHLKQDFDEKRTQKNRIARKGKKNSDSHREKLRQSNLGKKMSEETKKKISLSKYGTESPRKGHRDESKTICRQIANLYRQGKTRSELLSLGFKKGTIGNVIFQIKNNTETQKRLQW